jgi:hypothetical protein
MDKDRLINTKWKDVKKQYSDFLSSSSSINDEKLRSTLSMMSLWTFQADLLRENRFMELVWIHPNLTELTINSMLSTHFHIIGGGRQKVHQEFVDTLNLQQKNRLLYSLNLIDKELFNKLESWRSQRNSLIHKLMQKAKGGVDLEKESEQFCKSGIELQDRLHKLLMDEIRAAVL